MKLIHLFILPALAFHACTGLRAQVTIGGLTEPATGVVLDLNSPGGMKGGLVPSNVTLTDLHVIPADFIGLKSTPTDITVKDHFRGAIVYHIGGNDMAAGIYVWNGKRWTPAGGDQAITGTIKDVQNQEYSIAKFGDAGWWMTQNLRSTQFDDGNGTGALLDPGPSTNNDAKRYTYPGADNTTHTERANALSNEQLKAYGLLYSWAAASGRIDRTSNDTDGFGTNPPDPTKYHQGICPIGWHLPSDHEWGDLEKEIALHPWKYADQDDAYTFVNNTTYDGIYTTMEDYRPNHAGTNEMWWGRQMKSTTGVPNGTASYSSSFPHKKGGFDILLLGYVNSSTAVDYGSRAVFWTSSIYASDGVYRYLADSYTGVLRSDASKFNLFSVRCKKD
jgi:uncharacterized protein (TIGR02145 family)